MRTFIFFSALCLVLGWSYGESSSARSYSYGDSAGNRYGGTYGMNGGAFAGVGYFPPFMQSFWTSDDYFSTDYFSNLEVLLRDVTFQGTGTSSDPQAFPEIPKFRSLRPLSPLKRFMKFRPLNLHNTFPTLEPLQPLGFDRAFESNLENQRRAFTAARKAFDLTSNQAGYIPNFPTRYNNHGFGGFGAFPGFPMSGSSFNSAFAGGAAGPGYTHQVAAINPKNPKVENVNVMNRFSDTARNGDKDFYSVSSSSFVSSSNVDGKEKSHRKAETVVNRNGEISQFKVED